MVHKADVVLIFNGSQYLYMNIVLFVENIFLSLFFIILK